MGLCGFHEFMDMKLIGHVLAYKRIFCYVTNRFGPLANRIKMINFGMHYHNLLKYKRDPQGPKPLKVSEVGNLKELMRIQNTQNYATTPMAGLMQVGQPKCIQVTKGD